MTLTATRRPDGRSMHRRWPWHWPLAALIIPYPLWWLLGIASFMPAVAALVMVWQLRHADIRLPKGSAWWLAYLVWVGLSLVTLSSDAPGAVPDEASGGRLMVWVYGLTMYAACTVAMVWVTNSSAERLPFATIARTVGYLYLWSTLGGILGVLAPHLELRSLLESVLPGGLRSNSFVRSLVHPAVADIQSILGRAEARPKAPFPYANTWGSAMALSLPFLLIGWGRHGRRWQRLAVIPIVALSAIPIVYSLNRGLWACLAVGALFVVVALARRGNLTGLVVTIVVVAVAAVAFVASPLGDLVGQRFENQHSSDRREQLMVQTVEAAAVGSPVIGFGGTRDVQGSFASIAGGSTPECPACGVPPLGTQGHLWMVIFTQGLVGAFFFVVFLAMALWRALRPTLVSVQTSAVILIFFFIQMFVYDTLGLPLMIVMAAVGIAWRDDPSSGQGVSLRGLLRTVTSARRQIALLAVGGLIAGVAWSFVPRRDFVATNQVLLIDTPSYLPVELEARAPRRITIDTEAALVVSQQTLGTLARTGGEQAALRERLSVSAVPTTQVLVISLSGETSLGLDATLDEVTAAYLQTRRAYLLNRRDQVLAVIYERMAELTSLGRSSDSPEVTEVLTAIDNNLRTPTTAGEVIRRAPIGQAPQDFAKYGGSGLALGLLAWACAHGVSRGRSRLPIARPC